MQISFFQRAFSLNALSGLKTASVFDPLKSSPLLTTGLSKRQALDSFVLTPKPVHPAVIEQERQRQRQRQEAPRPVLYAPSPLPPRVSDEPEKPKGGVAIIDFDIGSGDDVTDSFKI